jgi:FkbM family methyltransferase
MKIRARSPWWQRLVRRLSRAGFRWAENNGDACIARNGERWLLGELLRAHRAEPRARPFVAFDVGANVGDYTSLILDEGRRAGCAVDVHAFEPSPVAAAQLRRRVAAEAAVRVAEVALADRAGEGTLHDGAAGSSHASLYERRLPPSVGAGVARVPLQRLDEYLGRHGVARVDLLKLDTEGSELAVLRGLGDRLDPAVVDVIQFEYGGTTRDAGVALRDLHELLVARGYCFTKLFPAALEVRAYQEWMDHFAFANYVAVAPHWMGPLPTRANPS